LGSRKGQNRKPSYACGKKRHEHEHKKADGRTVRFIFGTSPAARDGQNTPKSERCAYVSNDFGTAMKDAFRHSRHPAYKNKKPEASSGALGRSLVILLIQIGGQPRPYPGYARLADRKFPFFSSPGVFEYLIIICKYFF